jgi:predicted amidohydrolase
MLKGSENKFREKTFQVESTVLIGEKRKLRIALIQQFCEKAAIQQNLESISSYLDEAASRQVDIIGFPEMNITGYADPTLYPQAVIGMHGPEMDEFLGRTRIFPGLVLAGLIEENPLGKPFITQVVARQGKLVGFYRKVTIIDDEVCWFSAGNDVPVYRWGDLTFGISICADIHNESVFAACRRQGAKLVFELAAPGLFGDQTTRDWQSGYAWWEGECRAKLGGYACKHGLWVAVATQAGRTVDEDFPGGGYLFAPGGERVFATKDFSPGAAYLEIDLENKTCREIAAVSPPIP